MNSLKDRLTDINTTRSIEDWIRQGANDEDDTVSANFARYRNHFYDPQHGGAGYTYPLAPSGEPSPDWALEDTRSFFSQSYSFQDARQVFYDALTLDNKDNREQWMARTFYILGHVIHHPQDMAQPQHTRNDSHGGFILGPKSLYEIWTKEHPDDPAFANALAQPYGPIAFDTARKFWSTDEGKGIAQYSSYNFVSAGTNFTGTSTSISPNPNYPKPDGIGAVVSPRQITDSDLLGPGQPLTGEIDFIGTPVTDNYPGGSSGFNARTSSYSLFDADLTIAGAEKTFTLNRFNFIAAHELLIPRAVAYSAGLIDYFFRGRLAAEDVAFTDAGITLKVKNAIDPKVTPAWKNENLQGGSLVISYQFKLNGQDMVGVSNTVPLAENLAPGQVSQNIHSFTLSVPAGATEVKYRLVFRGWLGQENDAVAVGLIEPVSGFLVKPNYLPADGVAGSRVIYTRSGEWKLSDKSGLQAGDVDWKGGYVNGKPTKVLSWEGGRRYFPTSATPYIYQDGELFAVAPRQIYGAAITKDPDGKEWLVAICNNADVADIVYMRPNKKSDSPALYVPGTVPEGWREIGNFTVQAIHQTTPKASWLFNGSGTAAQTLRPRPFGESGNGHNRYKITINWAGGGASAAVQELGNLPKTTGTVTEKQVPYSYSMLSTETEPVETVVAVDYRDDEEVLATLRRTYYKRAVRRVDDLPGPVSNIIERSCPPGTVHTRVSGSRDIILSEAEYEDLVLSFTGVKQPIKYVNNKLDVVFHMQETSEGEGVDFSCDSWWTIYPSFPSWGHYIASYTGSHQMVQEFSEAKILHIDLRHGVLVYAENFDSVTESVVGSDQQDTGIFFERPPFLVDYTWGRLYPFSLFPHRGQRTVRKREEEHVVGPGLEKLLATRNVRDSTESIDRFVKPWIASSEVDFVTQYDNWGVNTVPRGSALASWIVDSENNFFVSQQYTDAGGTARVFNYLTNGDLGTVIPMAPSVPTYFPAKLLH